MDNGHKPKQIVMPLILNNRLKVYLINWEISKF